MKTLPTQRGLTLLETMLVLAIISGILLLSIRQYQSFEIEGDIGVTQQNVNTVFVAMANYFRANCNQAPFNTDTSPATIVVTSNQLTGFEPDLTGDLLTSMPQSRLVNNSDPALSYIMQFNRLTPVPDRTYPALKNPKQPIGKIIIWRMQVGVLLNNLTIKEQTATRLLAQCLSSPDTAGGKTMVTPCETPNTTGDYAVWERLPSLPGSQLLSTYWVSIPRVKQFTQMYTTYPILLLIDGTMTANQYFVCGSCRWIKA